MDLEIAFYDKLVKRYEETLNVSHNEINYSDMSKHEMAEFFNKDLNSIGVAILKMCKHYNKNLKYIEDLKRKLSNQYIAHKKYKM